MLSIDALIDDAEQHCFKQGTRLTHKRKQVLVALLKANKAVSAYELIDLYKVQCGETLPAMSIYRILDFLLEEHLAYKLALSNKYIASAKRACDQSDHSAQFLICRQCNHVKALHFNPAIIQALEDNAQSAGFILNSTQLELNCLCEECTRHENF